MKQYSLILCVCVVVLQRVILLILVCDFLIVSICALSNELLCLCCSIAESDSLDAESGFDEQEVTEVGANVVKFVLRFVDKVCSDSSVSTEHIRQLHSIVPGVAAMHMGKATHKLIT